MRCATGLPPRVTVRTLSIPRRFGNVPELARKRPAKVFPAGGTVRAVGRKRAA